MNIPIDLKNAICNNKLIAFTGAGLSYDMVNLQGQKIKGWGNLVNEILLDLKRDYDVGPLIELVKRYEPITVLELIEKDSRLPKKRIYSFMKEFLDLDGDANAFDLHLAISKLTNKIVTTNYDCAFELADSSLRKYKAYKGKNYELTTHKEINSRLLFKLHGCFEDSDSMVLFPSNYNALYKNEEKDAEHSLLVLKNIIYNNSLLIIGAGMGDFQINNIFTELKKLQGAYHQQHFIITTKDLDSSLDFLTPIKISDYAEIKDVINELLKIKAQCSKKYKEEDIEKLEDQLKEAKKRIKILEEERDPNKDKLLEREALKYFSKGVKYSLAEDYEKAIQKYKTSVELKPDLHDAFYNWGTDLGNLADTKGGAAAEELYGLAFEKFAEAIKLKPDDHEALYNWGTCLGNLAQMKEGAVAEELYGLAFEKFSEAIKIKPDKGEAFNNWGMYLGNLAQMKGGAVAEELYGLAFEKFSEAIKLRPEMHEAFYNWGTYLGSLARIKGGGAAEELYGLAFEKFAEAIQIKPDKHEAFYNWGTDLGDLAKMKGGAVAEELYGLAFEKFSEAIKLRPEMHEAFYNWGTYLGSLARIKGGGAAEELYGLAFEKFAEAIQIKPDKHEAFYNWGTDLGDLAKMKGGGAAEELYGLAFEKFAEAIQIKPDKHETFNNWGICLGHLANIKGGAAAEALYGLAFEKYAEAIRIKPDKHETFYNWGTDLGRLAKIKGGAVAEELYGLAFEKFANAIRIKPDKHEAFYNWGEGLAALAKLKEGAAAEELYDLAFEKLKKAGEYGGSYYNLSCLLAIRGKKKAALEYLQMSLEQKSISVSFVLEDEDWMAYCKDEDFLEIVNTFKDGTED